MKSRPSRTGLETHFFGQDNQSNSGSQGEGSAADCINQQKGIDSSNSGDNDPLSSGDHAFTKGRLYSNDYGKDRVIVEGQF